MILLVVVMVIVDSKPDLDEADGDDQGSGRVFPLLPPYQGVDFAANFNKLKSSGDAGYFIARDSIVVSMACYDGYNLVFTKNKQSPVYLNHTLEQKLTKWSGHS